MSPGTEFARDFCAGIGPLQLGVVLVLFLNSMTLSKTYKKSNPKDHSTQKLGS